MRYFSICLCVTLSTGVNIIGDMLIKSMDGKYPSMFNLKQLCARKVGTLERPAVNVSVMSIIEMTEQDYNDYIVPMPNVDHGSFISPFSQN